LPLQGTGRPGAPLYRSVRTFVRDARHNKLLAVPASLYAVNNYLKFAMQLYFKPTTAKMLGNLKVSVLAHSWIAAGMVGTLGLQGKQGHHLCQALMQLGVNPV
jgi:hypothetical protein